MCSQCKTSSVWYSYDIMFGRVFARKLNCSWGHGAVTDGSLVAQPGSEDWECKAGATESHHSQSHGHALAPQLQPGSANEEPCRLTPVYQQSTVCQQEEPARDGPVPPEKHAGRPLPQPVIADQVHARSRILASPRGASLHGADAVQHHAPATVQHQGTALGGSAANQGQGSGQQGLPSAPEQQEVTSSGDEHRHPADAPGEYSHSNSPQYGLPAAQAGWQQAWDYSWSCWYYYNEALQVSCCPAFCFSRLVVGIQKRDSPTQSYQCVLR